MSRVWHGSQKYMNVAHKDGLNLGPSKTVRTRTENSDYHRCKTLTDWLFVKYDMCYETFKGKSKKRKDELRREFSEDTGLPEFRHIESLLSAGRESIAKNTI